MKDRKAYVEEQSMDAGRELDKLIAEKVMGFAVCPSHVCGAQDYVYAVERGCEPCPACRWRKPADKILWDGRHYSTSIADAWQVVENLRQHYGDDIFIRRDGDKWGVGWIGVGDHGEDSFWVRGEADTAPLAICLAALARD